MIPTLSQVCSLPSHFDVDVTEYAAGGCHWLEVWLTKLEQFLLQTDLDGVAQLLEEQRVKTPVASFQGGLFQVAASNWTNLGSNSSIAWNSALDCGLAR